jgi:hypothetical protein
MQKEYFNTIQFIKDRVAQNLVQANGKGVINVERDQLERMIQLVKSTIEQAAIDASAGLGK